MKKLHLFSFIILNAVIGLGIILIYTDINTDNYRYSNLRDDSLVMYNPTGFTKEEQTKISENQVVDETDFAQTNLYYKQENNDFYLVSDEQYQPMLNANTDDIFSYITGNYLNIDYVDPDKINIVEGRMIEADDEIIIDEQLKTEIENQDFNQQELATIANNHKVVGTYASNDLYSGYCNEYQTYSQNDEEVSSTECQASNAYYTSEEVAYEQDFKTAVNAYNDFIISQNKQWSQTINSEDPTNHIDYEKSVENGVEDIIDPDSDEYGDDFQQIAYIKLLDETDKKDFIQEMKIMFPDSEILDKDSNLTKLTNFKQLAIIIIFTTILLNIVIFGPFLFQRKN